MSQSSHKVKDDMNCTMRVNTNNIMRYNGGHEMSSSRYVSRVSYVIDRDISEINQVFENNSLLALISFEEGLRLQEIDQHAD